RGGLRDRSAFCGNLAGIAAALRAAIKAAPTAHFQFFRRGGVYSPPADCRGRFRIDPRCNGRPGTFGDSWWKSPLPKHLSVALRAPPPLKGRLLVWYIISPLFSRLHPPNGGFSLCFGAKKSPWVG